MKLAESCGFTVTLRCQLLAGDLQTLVSIKSDEELADSLEQNDENALKESSPPASPLRIIIRAALVPLAEEVTSPHLSTAFTSYVSPLPLAELLAQEMARPAEELFAAGGRVFVSCPFPNGTGKLLCYPWYGCPLKFSLLER